jgi:hypothetical protein
MIKRPVPTSSSFDEKHNHNSNNFKDLEAPLLEKPSSSGSSSLNVIHKSDDDGDKVIEARCNLFSKSYVTGIFLGITLQALSFYASSLVRTQAPEKIDFVVSFVLYVLTKYWMPIALLLPTAIVAVRSRSLPGHMRLDAFLNSLRFQFGLFFGSLLLLSVINFYALAATAPLPLLVAYYSVCMGVSFVALCLLQIFIREVCVNISSIEVIVNYEGSDSSNDA